MGWAEAAPWLALMGYGALIWRLTPRNVSDAQFFEGGSARGGEPGLWLLVASAAITWIFAKSIANAASLGAAFGWWGGIGYAFYYFSFAVVGIAVYMIRTRGGFASLSSFLVAKYGPFCAKLFLAAIAIRLFNEVWSNTKVSALYFGAEGGTGYWMAALAVTAFTLFYSWRGGLRSSLLTDGAQMLLAAVLLVVILAVIGPGLVAHGPLETPPEARAAGITFALLALVQVLSYGFHDPVLTDRAFITSPKRMVKAFLLAGLVSGGFILLFSIIGLYAHANGLEGNPSVAVPAVFGLPMLLVFNVIMLTSAGSTLDSTFASTAKLGARDWQNDFAPPTPRHSQRGRWFMVAIALLGNLPLLSIYLGDKIGPAVIAATTISGTMVMGLAPIFLLAWLRPAGRLSFHMAFWPGLALGVIMTVESATGLSIIPASIDLGSGKYADDLGVNLFGLALCTGGYLAGAAISAMLPRAAAGRMGA
ncbi:MAG: Na+/proline symporter [Rhodospirillaceae bacterium]|nr:Na+/proline symporter [Rhodospirillaceae bacterium]